VGHGECEQESRWITHSAALKIARIPGPEHKAHAEVRRCAVGGELVECAAEPELGAESSVDRIRRTAVTGGELVGPGVRYGALSSLSAWFIAPRQI
jgi:hypothetical protein